MSNEMTDINLSSSGKIQPPKQDKIALIDADTVVFASCTMLEYVEDLLPRDMYTDEEWADLISQDGYVEEDNCIYAIYLDDAMKHSIDKIQQILDNTGCTSYELHFTSGRNNFRYDMVDNYKSNRKGGRAPQGMAKLKQMFVDAGMGTTHKKWEADDIVVALKRDNPDKYVLCAVDKDVLYSLPGRHFNYYQSMKYNIEMKFIEVNGDTALKHHYMQTLTGDPADGVIGIKGIGPKKAEKLLKDANTPSGLWGIVIDTYLNNKRDEVDAILNMRLVNMQQLHIVDGEYKVVLWKP